MSFDQLRDRLKSSELKTKFDLFYGNVKDSGGTFSRKAGKTLSKAGKTFSRASGGLGATLGRKSGATRSHDVLADDNNVNSPSSSGDRLGSMPALALESDEKLLKRQIKKTREILGQGGFSRVVKVRRASGALVAVKVHERRTEETIHQFKARVNREVDTMRKVQDHPNIIKANQYLQAFEVIEGSKRIYAVMEFVEGGSLEDVMVVSVGMLRGVFTHPAKGSPFFVLRTGALPLSEIQCNFKKLVQVVSYLQSKFIVHRDLKPANLLYTIDGVMKLSDFGSAADTQNVIHMLTSFGVTELWSAPEAACGKFGGKGTDPTKLDVYSCGVLFLLMFWGYDKMDKWLSDDANPVKTEEGFPPNHPAILELPEKMKALITRLVERDPAKRCSVAEIEENVWFQEIQVCGSDAEATLPHCHTLQQVTERNKTVRTPLKHVHTTPVRERPALVALFRHPDHHEPMSPLDGAPTVIETLEQHDMHVLPDGVPASGDQHSGLSLSLVDYGT
ncbi:CBL-interacting serine/threonine-protein kinase 24 [Gaertneriomyces sp. JEL0708]|nr:CBL-interacting serine/threonine-protein kinase 24 [Gaertneriomyces sp. JEL0708]